MTCFLFLIKLKNLLTVAFRIAVKMSRVSNPPSGSTVSKALLKVS